MLVEQYPTDKRFEDLLGYIPELSVELKKIEEARQTKPVGSTPRTTDETDKASGTPADPAKAKVKSAERVLQIVDAQFKVGRVPTPLKSHISLWTGTTMPR